MPKLKIKFIPDYIKNTNAKQLLADIAKQYEGEITVEIDKSKLPVRIMKKTNTYFFDNESICRDFDKLLELTAVAKQEQGEKQENIDKSYDVKITAHPDKNNIILWVIDLPLKRGD